MRRHLCGLVLLVAAFAPEPAAAQNYPWCALYNMRGGSQNCGFASLEQCRWTISGIGGSCVQNPLYVSQARYHPRRAKRSKRYR